MASLRRIVAAGRPPMWTVLVIPSLIIIGSGIIVLPPIFIGHIVDALTRRNFPGAMTQLGLYVIMGLLASTLGLINGYASAIFRESLARNVQLNLFAKLQRTPLSEIAPLTLGQVTNRLAGDIRTLTTQIEYSLFPTLSNVLLLLATVMAMVYIDYRFAIVSLVCSAVLVVPLRIAQPHITSLQTHAANVGDRLFGLIAEWSALPALRAMRNTEAARAIRRQLATLSREAMKLRVAQVVLSGCTSIATNLAGVIAPAAIMLLGAFLSTHGRITAGEIVTVLMYQSRLSAPINALSSLQATFATMGVAAKRLLQIFGLPDEQSGLAPFRAGEIAFEDTRVMHGARLICDRVDVRVAHGDHVALTGPSGGGKSSLAALINRSYEPARGAIRIAGADVREYTLESLRAAVCLVTQDPFIFDGSVLDNLRLNAGDVSEEQIRQAMALARFDTVLARLTDGLDTVVGQRGFRLSGGEGQRLCLARALLQNPDILILDEALTGIDTDLERVILGDLRRHLEGKTLIVITHRLESIAEFDRVMTLDRGKLHCDASRAEAVQ